MLLIRGNRFELSMKLIKKYDNVNKYIIEYFYNLFIIIGQIGDQVAFGIVLV